MKSFKAMGLLPQILKSLENKGYEHPTPIQEESIEHVLDGRDLLGIAQTGTGKTAAFSVPIIQNLAKRPIKVRPKNMRVLVLLPTRELASQVERNILTYSKGLNQKLKVIFGGVGQGPQVRALAQGLEYVIATPGRLLDLTNSGYVKYDQLEIFVLDEADRMLDMGMFNDIKKIIKKLPSKKQTLFFSATMPKDIEQLAKTLLSNPVKIEVTPESSTVNKIKQSICFLTKVNKDFLLAKLLTENNIQSALVFSRTKHGADKIVKKLALAGIDARAIHGNKSQANREKTLELFRDKKIKVLIATDIAARGLDIDHITHIINFNLPEDPSSYVHRIGRTARAGREGNAISFCDKSELSLLKSIEKHIKQKIPIDSEQPFHENLKEQENKLTKTREPTRGGKKKLSFSKKARRRRSFKG
jgi:ATP-dependent RNA helicase RhlE